MQDSELLAEVREDVKALRNDVAFIKAQIPHFVTWPKLVAVLLPVAAFFWSLLP